MAMLVQNNEYKVMYLRQPKTGSSTLMQYFPILGLNFTQLKSHNGLTDDEAARLFADYFVFTTVRNPWARAVSAYKHVKLTLLDRPECREQVRGAPGRCRNNCTKAPFPLPFVLGRYHGIPFVTSLHA